MLKEEYGCKYVLNSNSENFFEEFTQLVKEKNATCLIECIGGELTGKLMSCLPSRSTVVFYGALSEEGVS
jgi:NADPH:quinone reductase-like Zn-dependent oxidoreductase